jgi:hypothetical protein
VAGEGPPRLRNDYERRRFQLRRLQDTLQRFCRRLSQMEKRQCRYSRVNLLNRIKPDGVWILRSIPRKLSGSYDWGALPDGRYFVEWYEAGKGRRENAGVTIAQAQEAQGRKRHELQGRKLGVQGNDAPSPAPEALPLASTVTRYLEHIMTLKKPNT